MSITSDGSGPKKCCGAASRKVRFDPSSEESRGCADGACAMDKYLQPDSASRGGEFQELQASYTEHFDVGGEKESPDASLRIITPIESIEGETRKIASENPMHHSFFLPRARLLALP